MLRTAAEFVQQQNSLIRTNEQICGVCVVILQRLICTSLCMVQRYATPTQPTTQQHCKYRVTADTMPPLPANCHHLNLLLLLLLFYLLRCAALRCAMQPHVAQRKALTPSATSSPWSEGWAEAWQEEAGMSTHRRAVRPDT
eukprot:COSAG06_NODE_12015_length_1435_cov_1.717066_2_plen_141_part_00